jgi:hypothetical protein
MLSALAATFALVSLSSAQPDYDLEGMWRRFQADYERTYAKGAEDAKHFAAFKENVLLAIDLNAKQGVYCTDLFEGKDCMFGITKYSDTSPEELQRTLLARRPSVAQSRIQVPVLSYASLGGYSAKVVDWRWSGVVSSVNFQDKCGSCWAFSIAQQMESAFAMATGKLQKLSQQQIVSCDVKCIDGHGDCGCNGGDVVSGCDYVHKAGGLAPLADYPDTSSSTGISGNCTPGVSPIVKLKSFAYAVRPCNHSRDARDERPCDAQDETSLANVVALKGPVSVSLTWGPGWWSYKGGIYDLTCSNTVADINHAMQIVGYDMSGNKPYWIVRNTFGSDWGIGGYIHLAMGSNLCGVANEAVMVEVESARLETYQRIV